MASKNNSGRAPKDSVNIKHVKNAGWVKTTIVNGRQTQEWSQEKPAKAEEAR